MTMISMYLALIFAGNVHSLSVRAPPAPRKSLGRTSFVRQQDIIRGNDELSPDSVATRKVLSPEQLLELASASARRAPHSLKDRRAWFHWSDLAVEATRRRMLENLPHPVCRTGFEALWFQLGVAADVGAMPSFADAGARSGYAVDFFCRARLLGDLLFDAEDNPTWHTKRLIGVVGPEFGIGAEGGLQSRESTVVSVDEDRPAVVCNMTSLGGGPGFDFFSAAMVAVYQTASGSIVKGKSGNPPVFIRASIMDYEEGWQDLVEAMNIAVHEGLLGENPNSNEDNDSPLDMSCTWGGRCDITKPITNDPLNPNKNVLAQMAETNLFTCQYCVSENLLALRESNFVFFRDLMHGMRQDALLLLTETTPRVWPDLYDLMEEMNEDEGADYVLDMHFPRNTSRGKKGRQLLITKRKRGSGPELSISDSEIVTLVDGFRDKLACHEARLENGHRRQVRKVRGAKESVDSSDF